MYPYVYEEMLDRLQSAKSQTGEKKNVLPAIKVTIKNRRSIISNFADYSKILNRPADHIRTFYRIESGMENSINDSGQLIIQGYYQESKCETVMRKYVEEYVLCKQCKCIDTELVKSDGLTFLECHQCLARTSMGKTKNLI